MQSKNLILITALVALVILGGWYYLKSQNKTAPVGTAPMITPAPSPAPSASSGAMMHEEHKVSITASGFVPKTITIKAGQSVTWTNNDTQDHTVNSAPHPTHTAYPPLNLGVIKPGESKSLAFPTAGTYKYHDHLNPSLTGSVVVE